MSFAGGIYDYWCNGEDISGAQAAETTYKGQGERDFEAVALTDVYTDSETTSSSSSTDGGSNTSDAGPSDTGSSDTGGSGGDDDSSNNNDDDDEGTPVGPIVGGVVGGVGALGIGGLAAWLLIRRRNAKTAGGSGSGGDGSSQPTPQAYSALPMQHPTPPHGGPAGYYGQDGQWYNVQHHVPPPGSSTPGTMHTNTASYSSPSPAYGGYGQHPPPPVIHEAPGKPSEMLRDERHELQ